MYGMDARGLVALALQVLLPLLVGLVTKQSWPDRWKALLLLAFTAVGQFLLELEAALSSSEVTFDWRRVLYAVVIGFVISAATHFGLWKPVGATAVVQQTLVTDGHSDDRPAHSRR